MTSNPGSARYAHMASNVRPDICIGCFALLRSQVATRMATCHRGEMHFMGDKSDVVPVSVAYLRRATDMLRSAAVASR